MLINPITDLELRCLVADNPITWTQLCHCGLRP
jgi:hypothetical protein